MVGVEPLDLKRHRRVTTSTLWAYMLWIEHLPDDEVLLDGHQGQRRESQIVARAGREILSLDDFVAVLDADPKASLLVVARLDGDDHRLLHAVIFTRNAVSDVR